MIWKPILLSVLILVIIFILSCQKGGTIKVGEEALDFQLMDFKGRSYHLKDYKGTLVHLHFWADWCPRCHEEFDKMEMAYRRLKKANPDFEILAVNVDQHRVHVEEFTKKHEVTFPVLLDVGAKVSRGYGVKGLPCNFLIGKDLKVKEVILGWIDEKYLEKSIEHAKALKTK